MRARTFPPLALALGLLGLGPAPARAVQFEAVQTLQSGIGNTAVLTLGPEDPDPGSVGDGCVYATNRTSGAVHRICFGSSKAVSSNSVVVDLNGAGGVDGIQGIAIDPDSDPAGEIHLYLAYADDDTAPYQGKIARAVSLDGGASYAVDEDFVTGLPRSNIPTYDHQTNGLAFGPDGCLYIAQGNNSNAGYDRAFAESRLSGAIVRVCFKLPDGSVDPAYDRDCGGGSTQAPCDLEVYASGMRNPWDLVWHSNGALYGTDNDANPGFRDDCPNVANTFGCPCQEPPVSPIGDELNRIEPGLYYGSPNPYRANPAGLQCNGGSGSSAGDACSVDADCGFGGVCADLSALCTDGYCGDDVHCFYFGYGSGPQPGEDPNGIYRQPIAQISSLLDGIAEYRAPFQALRPGSFCSDWDGDLLVTGGPGSVRRFVLSGDGLAASHAGTGNLNGLTGLDVVVGPDGTIYVADWSNGRVRYIEPVAQPDSGPADFFVACDPGLVCTGTACALPPPTPALSPAARVALALLLLGASVAGRAPRPGRARAQPW